MAKTTAPLLSFGANGQIGKTQVYGSWRGVSYARRYVVPANPNSDGQKMTRGVFNWLNQVWKLADPAFQGVWTAFAKGKPLTDRNAFIKSNLAALRGTTLVPVTDIDDLISSPGFNGGLALVTAVATDGGTHHITMTVTPPAMPDGWAYVKSHAIALSEQNAQTDVAYASVYDSDVANPGVCSLLMPAAGDYVCSAWAEYTKPDGSTAFSPSITHPITLA